MKIFLASDHRGFNLKESLKKKLIEGNYLVEDLGNDQLDPGDDYVDFAKKVGEKVVSNQDSLGILLCGSGAGMDMAANKIEGIRAALAFDSIRAKQARLHENANIISLPADILDEEKAWSIVKVFLTTPFSKIPRHIRRLKKISELEEEDNNDREKD